LIADYVQEMKSPHDPDITLDPGTAGMSNLEAPTSPINTLEKKWDISTIFKANPNDLHKAELGEPKIATPLTAIVQPPLMEEKSLFNQEALDFMTHADKNHFVHHINTEDKNVLEFLGDFNFSNPIMCTDDEIDEFLECTNSCDAGLDREVVDVVILAKSTEKDCALAYGYAIVLEVIQEEEEQMLLIFQVDTASGEEDDIILPSLKLQRVQPPLFKGKPISLIPSSPLATPSIIVGTFESSLYQPQPPPNLYFIQCPTPTRLSTLARLSSLRPQPLDDPQTINHIRSFILNKFLSSIYTLESTIIHSWKKLYHFTRPPDLPQFHPLFQGFFIIIFLLHSLPRYCMLWLDVPADSVSTPLWMKSLGLYCKGDG